MSKSSSLEKIRVQAPASTSNLGPGYDVLGLALDVMYDVVEISKIEEQKIELQVEGVGADRISRNSKYNSAGRVAIEFLGRCGQCGLQVRIVKGIPPGSGLGSSGASAAATAVGLDILLNTNLSKSELTRIASLGEIAAAGAPHADNVAPAILGGFTIIRSYQPFDVISFPPPRGVDFALAVPQNIRKTTRRAREVLPKQVDLARVINNMGGVSIVTAGMLLSDAELIGQGMLRDQIVEPARIHLYPGCMKAREAAVKAGASGATLSGAGPTVIAVVNPKRASARSVSLAMRRAFESEGVDAKDYVCHPGFGARVIE